MLPVFPMPPPVTMAFVPPATIATEIPCDELPRDLPTVTPLYEIRQEDTPPPAKRQRRGAGVRTRAVRAPSLFGRNAQPHVQATPPIAPATTPLTGAQPERRPGAAVQHVTTAHARGL